MIYSYEYTLENKDKFQGNIKHTEHLLQKSFWSARGKC